MFRAVQRLDKDADAKRADEALRIAAENEYTSRCLACYAAACGEISAPQLGLEMLEVHRRQRKATVSKREGAAGQPFGTAALYRAYFGMAASHGDERMCGRLVRMAEEDAVELDEQMVSHLCRAIAGAESVTGELESAVTGAMDNLAVDAPSLVAGMSPCGEAELAAVVAGLKRLFPTFEPEAARRAEMGKYETPLLANLNARDTSNLAPNHECGSMGLFERQLSMEQAGVLTFDSVLPAAESQKEVDRAKAEDKVAEDIIEGWRADLVQSLRLKLDKVTSVIDDERKLQEMMQHGGYGQLMVVYPFLSLMPAEDYVDVLLQEVIKIMQESEHFGVPVRTLEAQIGAAVRNRYVGRRMSEVKGLECETGLDRYRRAFAAYLDWLKDPAAADADGAGKAWCHREAFLHCAGEDVSHALPAWPTPVKVAVGRELLNRLGGHLMFS